MSLPATAADCAAAWRGYRRGRILPLAAIVAGGVYVLAAEHWPALQPHVRVVAAIAALAGVAAKLRYNARLARFACPRCGQRFHDDEGRRLAWRTQAGRHCVHCGLELFDCG